MAAQVIEATRKGVEEKLTVEYDFGDSLEDMVEKFGEKVVYAHAKANMVVALQGRLREWGFVKGEDGEYQVNPNVDLQAKADEWKPTEGKVRKSEFEKLAEKLGGLSEEEKARLAELLNG